MIELSVLGKYIFISHKIIRVRSNNHYIFYLIYTGDVIYYTDLQGVYILASDFRAAKSLNS